MWRARVIRKNYEGRVIVVIPKLFGDDPVGPIQSAVDAVVDDEVVVADLNPDAKVRDWWVVGFASQIGRWGSPYPHEHPMGQVVGLVDALAGKADVGTVGSASSWADITDKPATFPPSGHTHAQADVTGLPALASDIGAATYLPTPDTIPRRAANGGFRVVTGTALQDAVNIEYADGRYVAKSDMAGSWVNCSVSASLVVDVSGQPPLSVRSTPLGMQIRGRMRTTASIALDATLFTLPTGFTPSYPILFGIPVMGPGSAYDALTWGCEFQTSRAVTARQNYVSGARMSFNHIIQL